MNLHEQAMHLDAIDRLRHDFVLHREVRGEHYKEGQGVRIDLMAKPREHMLALGMIDKWFGIEVKYDDGVHPAKAAKTLRQCESYMQSQFTIEDETVYPLFVLYYVPTIKDDSYKALHPLAIHGGIGRLIAFNDGWRIQFANAYATRYSKYSLPVVDPVKLMKPKIGCI